jgi:hypothetical protein
MCVQRGNEDAHMRMFLFLTKFMSEMNWLFIMYGKHGGIWNGNVWDCLVWMVYELCR